MRERGEDEGKGGKGEREGGRREGKGVQDVENTECTNRLSEQCSTITSYYDEAYRVNHSVIHRN